MKNTNTVRTEIHYAQVGEYQLPLLTLPQTDDTEPLGKYGRMRLAAASRFLPDDFLNPVYSILGRKSNFDFEICKYSAKIKNKIQNIGF